MATGAQVAGQQYTTDAANARRVGHLIADAVFTRVTGEKGFFDSRVVFVDETGSKEKRRKRMAVMDMDGANVKYLTAGDSLVVTPRFSPSAQMVAFMSFRDNEPRVTLLDLETGQREVVGNFPGMTFAPRFSPDGQRVILSLSDGSSSNLYTMDLKSRATTRLTDGGSIDTSPSYSPDGQQIAFESDRGGTQQIYVMSAGGGDARRISFGDGRYSTPAWSPRGDLIAFTRQKDGQFGIGVMKPDGSGERIITEGFLNEGPTFAPNGLFVMFFRDPGGESGPKIFMADIFGHGEFPVPTPGYASDPSWGPLMSCRRGRKFNHPASFPGAVTSLDLGRARKPALWPAHAVAGLKSMPHSPSLAHVNDALYRRVAFALIPFLFVCYVVAMVDRLNVGYAKLSSWPTCISTSRCSAWRPAFSMSATSCSRCRAT